MFFGATVKDPCMEDLLGSLLLTTMNQNGPKITVHVVCRDASTECCFNEHAGECRLVRFTFFVVLDKSKSIPIRIGGQTA